MKTFTFHWPTLTESRDTVFTMALSVFIGIRAPHWVAWTYFGICILAWLVFLINDYRAERDESKRIVLTKD